MTPSMKQTLLLLGLGVTSARSSFVQCSLPASKGWATSCFENSPNYMLNAVSSRTESSATELPYFLAEKKGDSSLMRQSKRATDSESPTNVSSATLKSAAIKNQSKSQTTARTRSKGGAHKEGLLSPIVLTAKRTMGDQSLNQLRGKAISIHSDVIKGFVSTAETEIGLAALASLYKLADRNGDGQLQKEEVAAALKGLGFSWLKDKQVEGILKRADSDSDGVIDFDEFVAEAPKTLKTNLVKLAKKNGGELGLLV